MKIGLPKIRLSRKLLFVLIGLFVLAGGSTAAALIFAGDKLLGPPVETVIGGECLNIQTMVIKTPASDYRLRKFVRMESADGPTRIKTALRVAGLLAKDDVVDLIHVSVIDTKGPDKRSAMRGRAIGADVIFALRPDKLPDLKQPVIARYYDGTPNAEGMFYGKKIELDLAEIKAMMTAMKDVEDKTDCAEPEKPESEKKDAHKPAAKEHGEKPAAEHGEKAAEGDKAAEGEHGDKKAEGEHPAPVEEKGFLDSMMSMVGLGGEEPAPEGEHKAEGDHPAKDGEHAAEPVEGEHAAEPDAHASEPAKDGEHAVEPDTHAKDAGHEAPADATSHDEQAAEPAKDGEHAAPAEGEHAPEGDKAAEAEHAAPAAEEGFFDSMMSAVGLGGEEPPAAEPEAHAAEPAKDGEHAAEPDAHASEPAKDGEHAAEPDAHAAEPAKDGEHAAEPDAHAKDAAHEAPAEATSHDEHAAEPAKHDEHPVVETPAEGAEAHVVETKAHESVKPKTEHADHGEQPAADHAATDEQTAEH